MQYHGSRKALIVAQALSTSSDFLRSVGDSSLQRGSSRRR
jgi:hypothetical protein